MRLIGLVLLCIGLVYGVNDRMVSTVDFDKEADGANFIVKVNTSYPLTIVQEGLGERLLESQRIPFALCNGIENSCWWESNETVGYKICEYTCIGVKCENQHRNKNSISKIVLTMDYDDCNTQTPSPSKKIAFNLTCSTNEWTAERNSPYWRICMGMFRPYTMCNIVWVNSSQHGDGGILTYTSIGNITC